MNQFYKYFHDASDINIFWNLFFLLKKYIVAAESAVSHLNKENCIASYRYRYKQKSWMLNTLITFFFIDLKLL